MRKTGGALRPYNVELPMMGVLPDFLQYAHTEITRRADAEAGWNAGSGPAGGPSGGLTRRLSAAALRATLVDHYPLLGLISPSVFDDAVGYGERVLKNRTARGATDPTRQKDQVAARRNVDSERAALHLLERQCTDVIADFEEAHPASVLAGGIQTVTAAGVGRAGGTGTGGGQDLETETTLTPHEAASGATLSLRLGVPTTCAPCAGTGIRRDGRGGRCPDCAGDGLTRQPRTLTVRTPAGLRNGQRLRLAGKGSPGADGEPAGDLFLVVNVGSAHAPALRDTTPPHPSPGATAAAAAPAPGLGYPPTFSRRTKP